MSINDIGAPLSLEAQHTNRYALAANDMQEVQQYLQAYHRVKQLMNVDNMDVIAMACQGILSAAIVAYCRPFLRSDSAGFATPRVDGAELKSVHFLLDLHDLLLKKRNKFIAHADWSARKAEVAIEGDRDIQMAVTVPDVFEGIDLKKFLILATGVFHECLGKTLAHGIAARAAAAPKA